MENFSKADFQLGKAALYQGDAARVLSTFKAELFDVIFADPPYKLSNNGTTCHAGKRVSVNKGVWDKSCGIERDQRFQEEWISACARVLKKNGSLWISGTYHNIFTCGYTLLKSGWHILNDIIWFKPNAAPNLACRMFTASHETLIWARKSASAKHYFDYEAMKNGDWPGDALKKPGKQMRSVWSLGFPKKQEKAFGKHPTQKPLDLLRRILLASCPPGGLVLDPFCGSGTSGVAALSLGMGFVGIDAEMSYLKGLALPRLKEVLDKGKKDCGIIAGKTASSGGRACACGR